MKSSLKHKNKIPKLLNFPSSSHPFRRVWKSSLQHRKSWIAHHRHSLPARWIHLKYSKILFPYKKCAKIVKNTFSMSNIGLNSRVPFLIPFFPYFLMLREFLFWDEKNDEKKIWWAFSVFYGGSFKTALLDDDTFMLFQNGL